jgi:hypothetical protein
MTRAAVRTLPGLRKLKINDNDRIIVVGPHTSTARKAYNSMAPSYENREDDSYDEEEDEIDFSGELIGLRTKYWYPVMVSLTHDPSRLTGTV